MRFIRRLILGDEILGMPAALGRVEDTLSRTEGTLYSLWMTKCRSSRALPSRRTRSGSSTSSPTARASMMRGNSPIEISESATRSGIAVDMESLIKLDAALLGKDREGREAYAALAIAVRGGPEGMRRSRRAAAYLARSTGARALPVMVSARIDDSIADEVVDSVTLEPERRGLPEDKVIWVKTTMPS